MSKHVLRNANTGVDITTVITVGGVLQWAPPIDDTRAPALASLNKPLHANYRGINAATHMIT